MIIRNGSSQVIFTTNLEGGKPPVTIDQISWVRKKSNVLIIIDVDSAKYELTFVELSQFYLTIESPSILDSGLYSVTVTHEAWSACTLDFELEVLGMCALILIESKSILHS